MTPVAAGLFRVTVGIVNIIFQPNLKGEHHGKHDGNFH